MNPYERRLAHDDAGRLAALHHLNSAFDARSFALVGESAAQTDTRPGLRLGTSRIGVALRVLTPGLAHCVSAMERTRALVDATHTHYRCVLTLHGRRHGRRSAAIHALGRANWTEVHLLDAHTKETATRNAWYLDSLVDCLRRERDVGDAEGQLDAAIQTYARFQAEVIEDIAMGELRRSLAPELSRRAFLESLAGRLSPWGQALYTSSLLHQTLADLRNALWRYLISSDQGGRDTAAVAALATRSRIEALGSSGELLTAGAHLPAVSELCERMRESGALRSPGGFFTEV